MVFCSKKSGWCFCVCVCFVGVLLWLLVIVLLLNYRKHGIGEGATDIWTCDTFDTIQEHQPNIVMMSYKETNKLQKVLAQKYCPELINELPIHKNTGTNKGLIHVKLLNSNNTENSIPDLGEWMERKKQLIEWSLGLYKDASCRGKMRDVENILFHCEDEVMTLSRT